MSTVKKTRGRQKIQMKKMTNEGNLQVTFSKRRSGLFKKASELSTLCGADVALIVFSPSEKVFSFGSPTIEAVINRYLSQVPPQNDITMQFIAAHRSAKVHELNETLTQATNQLEADKKNGEQLNHMREVIESQFWPARPVKDMNARQLKALGEALKVLQKDLTEHIDQHIIQGASPPFFNAGASLPSNTPLQQPPAQMFPSPRVLQNPMMQAHMYEGMIYHHGFNNMGGYRGF